LPVLIFVLLSLSPALASFRVHRETALLGLLLLAAVALLLLLTAVLLLLGDLDDALQDAVVGLLLCDGAEVPVLLLLLPSCIQRVEDLKTTSFTRRGSGSSSDAVSRSGSSSRFTSRSDLDDDDDVGGGIGGRREDDRFSIAHVVFKRRGIVATGRGPGRGVRGRVLRFLDARWCNGGRLCAWGSGLYRRVGGWN
jgi:hypothetical protein